VPLSALSAVALVAGAACGALTDVPPQPCAAPVPLALLTALVCARYAPARVHLFSVLVVCGFALSGAALASAAREEALSPPLRALLDREIGGFAIDSPGPEQPHDPLPVRLILRDDAAVQGGFVSLRGDATAVSLGSRWHPVPAAGVRVTVGGAPDLSAASRWTSGRTVVVPVTFRRPARYLNEGVPDGERDLSLDGTTLFGSAKSGLLVAIEEPGTHVEELAAGVRAHVRRAVARWVGGHDPVTGAVVTAVLIGDRSALPDEVRERLQAAGVYHVIAISGGNIAILAGLVLVLLAGFGVRGRPAAALTLVALILYAQIVAAGPSVWRATLMAIVHLAARAGDHRAGAWHAMAVAAALMVTVRPLDVRDPGFILTFGATAALIEGARRAAWASSGGRADAGSRTGRGGRAVIRLLASRWLMPVLLASAAVELALMPVSATAFSRITFAGLLLNLVAVPAMALVQAAGMAVVVLDGWGPCAAAGLIAHYAAEALLDSARLVDLMPWLARRVPPPGPFVLLAYYVALALVLVARRRVRVAGGICLTAMALTIATGFQLSWPSAPQPRGLRLTVFDVGQAEAMLLEAPGARPLMVDAGGSPFEQSGFDISGRVLAPALWARAVRRFGILLATHGDPDHIGGATRLVRDFRPGEFWTGVDVPSHEPSRALASHARSHGAAMRVLRAGHDVRFGGARIRVLHPPEPDWERPRVRNDDSVVLEVLYGDTALLLTGDIGADVERAILPRLTPAPRRVLKVAHHGSRTSTSRELLDGWRPQLAVISCGRGNRFGHPSRDVLARLDAAGVRVVRTDVHGQITIETDGHDVSVRTYAGDP
jgi:competence protein ComEC